MGPDACGAGHAARRVGTKGGRGVSSQAKKCASSHFRTISQNCAPHNFLFIIQVIPDMFAGVKGKCEPSQYLFNFRRYAHLNERVYVCMYVYCMY